MAEHQTAIAEIRSLCIRDGSGNRILEDVNLSVQPSRPLFILGPSGAGKSTVINALLGALPNDFSASGQLAWQGRETVSFADMENIRKLRGEGFAVLPQNARAALDPTMRLRRQLVAANPKAALKAVDLPAGVLSDYPFMLSGGMIQRFSLASALSQGAGLVLADEPTKGMDARRRNMALDMLKKALDQGYSMIIVTHDPVCLRRLGGDAAVIYSGRVVERAPADLLLHNPNHPYSRAWVAADPEHWLPSSPAISRGEVLVEAHDLGISYRREKPLFSGINLKIQVGDIVGLQGDSGSGKSTLGNIVLGLLRPTSGSVHWVDGVNPAGREAMRLRRYYQKLYQEPASSFSPFRKVGQQLSDLPKVVPDLDLAQALPPLCERLCIDMDLLDKYPGQLSGGEGQRLALARVLLLSPRLIVADEPTSQLDPVLQREVIMLLSEIVRERQIGMLLIGHDPALIEAVSSKTLVIQR